MIETLHLVAARGRAFISSTVTRVCAFRRAAIERARALFRAMPRFRGD